MADAILADLAASAADRRRVRAALGHVIGFWTWRSLSVDQGLATWEAAVMAAGFVLALAMSLQGLDSHIGVHSSEEER